VNSRRVSILREKKTPSREAMAEIEKSPKVMRGSYRNDVSPLTQGLNYSVQPVMLPTRLWVWEKSTRAAIKMLFWISHIWEPTTAKRINIRIDPCGQWVIIRGLPESRHAHHAVVLCLWNSVPFDLRRSHLSVLRFRPALKTFLFHWPRPAARSDLQY